MLFKCYTSLDNARRGVNPFYIPFSFITEVEVCSKHMNVFYYVVRYREDGKRAPVAYTDHEEFSAFRPR